MSESGSGQKPSSSNCDATKPYAKPHRAPRACVRCKSQKIRCDGHSQPNKRCSACATSMETCQYVDSPGYLSYTQRKYIESLEDRIEKLEALLEKLHPGESFPELNVKKANLHDSGANITRMYVDDASLVQQSSVTHILTDRRFYGAFSDPTFFRTIVDGKLKESGKQWDDLAKAVRERTEKGGSGSRLPSWQKRILISDTSYRLSFPSDDLMASLIDLYFAYDHMYRPILHRPTFEKMVRTRVHEKDQYFGALVLMVCACGARWSEDPRTRQSADDKDSAGWIYYEQVHRLPRPISEPVSLVRLQMYNLMLIFLDGLYLISLEWSLIGMGMRLALDVGAHLNSSFANVSPSERELWKRAFWGLFLADQLTSVSLGRKCVIFPEEIDLDLPLEVDDEYWHPGDHEMAFVQPPDKPAVVAGFNSFIRLMCLIPKLAQLTGRPTTPLSQGEAEAQGEQILGDVIELDSALNQWLGSLPAHLEWNPNHTHPIYFAQSSMLHSFYYKSVIMIHRSFFSFADNQGNPANRTTPFVLCTNAARACGHILHTFTTRVQRGGAPWVSYAAFVAGIMLFLDVWAGGTEDSMRATRECVESLGICEDRYTLARVIRGAFRELFSLTGLSTSPTPDNVAVHPVEHANLPILNAGLADISLNDLTFSFDFPLTTISTDFYSLDSVPVGLESEAALLQDWNHSDIGAGWDIWSLLSGNPSPQGV